MANSTEAKMSEKGVSEPGDPEVANIRSDTSESLNAKDVGDGEREVADWTAEEERALVRK